MFAKLLDLRELTWTAEIQIQMKIDVYSGNQQFKQLQINLKKILDFNGIRTHGLYVSAAVLLLI